MNRVRMTVGTLAASAVMVGGVAVAPALAAPVPSGVERERHARCSASSTYELALEKEGKRIEADLDVEATRTGQRWKVRMYHNGKRIAKVTRHTDGDGEFDVDRTVRNKKGRDTITFRAVSSTGEVCRGSLRI